MTARKKVLFIGINYYAYIGRLCEAFESAGFDVDYHEIEPVDFWAKTRKKLFPKAYWRKIARYHAGVIDRAAAIDYDFVLFIQVHHLSHENMLRLRSTQKKARFVLYNWDSLSTHDYRPWLSYFDKVATFDPADSAAIGVDYFPLFALDDYFSAVDRREKDVDIYFVGAIGTFQRFDALKRLKAYCAERRLSTFFHLKCSPVMMLRLLSSGRYMRGMTFRSIGFSEIIALIERSKSVFDFANHRQSGHTLRFVENMCAGLKIVTENGRIEGEDFHRADRFFVLKDFNFDGIDRFVETPITSKIDTEPFRIQSWVVRLLS